MKSATTNSTEDQALTRIRSSIQGRRVIPVEFGSPQFRKYVWKPEYRAQVLQHATVYNANLVLFVTASVAQILYVVIIHFPSVVRTSYVQFAESMRDKYLAWYQAPPSEYPENLNLAHAVDINTLTLWKHVAVSTREYLGAHPEIGAAHDIRPHLVSLWNHFKGGQDVVSRILKNVKIDFRSLSPRAFVFIRQIMTQLLNAHLVLRIVQWHLSATTSATYSRLKRQLNEMQSFRCFLWTVGEQWEFCDDLDTETQTQGSNENGNPNVPKRNRLDFFNKEVGKRIRLSEEGHDLMQRQKPKRCLLCRINTTCKCMKCDVPLCRFVHGQNRTSCWVKHHTRQRIELLSRK